jgi:processive 1,2-diacylglycerol beta-glucosyltransferase
MAGSHAALGRLDDVARALVSIRGPVHGVFVAGRDEALRERLSRLTDGARQTVLGYTRDVRLLMAAADILVTKAGGMTLAEAFAAELPVICYGSLPGQERRNERFASRAGVALIARTRAELRQALARALGDGELLEHLRDRLAAVRHPDAAERIVDVALERSRLAS